MDDKTNVMRVLDKNKIKYNMYHYVSTRAYSGVEVAKMINKEEQMVFKTLVLVGKTKKNYVFMIPVAKELDLKKAAKAVNEKSVEMLPQKELLPLTGYVHGGCSPIGMKKVFVTVVDKTAEEYNSIIFSAGKIGSQVEISLNDLGKIVRISTFDLVEE